MSRSAMTRINSILSDAFHRGAALGWFTRIITLGIVVTAGVPAVAKIISIGPSPDLIPTSLSYASKFGLFTVVVKNQGTAATPAGVDIGNSFYVGGTRVTWGIVPGPLAPGASVPINSLPGGAYTISPGTHTIGVLVDDVDRIAESNKTNNKLSRTITVTATSNLPDLIPTSLSYNSRTRLFTSVVKNKGVAATPKGVVIGNSFYLRGTRVTWGIVPGPLAPGASVTINSLSGGAYTISPGKHTIGVLVDDVDRIAESNKNNNRRGGESITVLPLGSIPE